MQHGSYVMSQVICDVLFLAGPPVKLVDIDLGAGYQEWANIKFVCKGVEEFSRKIHLVEPVGKLRTLISQTMGLPKRLELSVLLVLL